MHVGLILGSLEEVLHRKGVKTFSVTHLTKYVLRSGVMKRSNDNVSSLVLTTETSVNHKPCNVKITKRLLHKKCSLAFLTALHRALGFFSCNFGEILSDSLSTTLLVTAQSFPYGKTLGK